jgi:membrane protease YdiL (CAAX protease family)
MNKTDKKPGFFGIIISQSVILVAGVILLLWGDINWRYWGFDPLVDLLLALMAAFLTYGIIYIVYLYGSAFSASLLADVQKITVYFSDYSWFKISCVALLAGVGEELLFRIALQSWLVNHIPVYLAIIAPALVFGLLHFLSWPYFIAATLMGLVFGVSYHLTQSAMLVIVWHAVYDLIALGVIIKYPHVLGLPSRANKNPFLS